MPGRIPIDRRVRDHLARRYEIGCVLGAGGAGIVLEARDRELDRPVAIKVQVLDALDEQTTARFRYEARTLARIEDPNVVKVYELEEIESNLCLVCELVPGGSLADLLEREPVLPVDRATGFASGIVRGLRALHREDIIHRDLKPGNVLLGAGLVPKLADLGLAKGPDRSFQTRAGLVLGTPRYMAPEQLTGKPHTAAVDFYALGVLLYEMVAGRPPYEAEDDSKLLRIRLREEPTPLARVMKGCPAWLDRLVAELLTREADQRLADHDEVLSRLASARKSSSAIPTREVGPEELRGVRAAAAARISGKVPGPEPEPAHSPRPVSGLRATSLISKRPSLPPPAVATRSIATKPSRPSRRWIPAAVVPAAGLVLAFLILGRSGGPALTGTVSIQAGDGRLAFDGTLVGAGPFLWEWGSGDPDGWREGTSFSGEGARSVIAPLPVDGSAMAGPLGVRLRSGPKVLFEARLPLLIGGWTHPELARLRLDVTGLEGLRWTARFEDGVGGVHEISGAPAGAPAGDRHVAPTAAGAAAAGAAAGDRHAAPAGSPLDAGGASAAAGASERTIVMFADPVLDAWPRIRLVEIRGQGLAPDRSGEVPGRPLQLRMAPRRELLAAAPLMNLVLRRLREAEQGAAVPGRPGRAGATPVDPRAIPGRLCREVLGLAPDAPAEMLVSRVAPALAASLADPGLPLDRRAWSFQWLQALALVDLWSRDRGVTMPLDADRLLQRFLPVSRVPYGSFELPFERGVYAFTVEAQPQDSVGESLTTLAFTAFFDGEFMLPREPGRPPKLASIGEVKGYLPRHQVQVSGAGALRRDRAVLLRLGVHGMFRHYYFTLALDRGLVPLTVGFLNPENEFNVEHPGTGTLLHPTLRNSWKNFPVTTVQADLTFPAGFFPEGPPETIAFQYHALPGASRGDVKACYLVRAEWLPAATQDWK